MIKCHAVYAGSKALSVQLVPRIESVNGSDINMGCASPLVDRGGVMVCNNSESYLVDGCSPAINTSTSNWASQLVTLREVLDRSQIHFDHVLLTFSFNTAVSLTVIELDLFLCPEWNIGAPIIFVRAANDSDLIFSLDFEILAASIPSQSSCDSLSTVSIPLLEDSSYSYLTWFILVRFLNPHEDWVHVGEVRFLNGSVDDHPSNRCRPEITPGALIQHGVYYICVYLAALTIAREVSRSHMVCNNKTFKCYLGMLVPIKCNSYYSSLNGHL